jgi:hypothetical protein
MKFVKFGSRYPEQLFPLHPGEDHAEISFASRSTARKSQFLDHLVDDVMPALIERLTDPATSE